MDNMTIAIIAVVVVIIVAILVYKAAKWLTFILLFLVVAGVLGYRFVPSVRSFIDKKSVSLKKQGTDQLKGATEKLKKAATERAKDMMQKGVK